MNKRRGRVPGATLHEQAARVAGCLAETSQGNLIWRKPDAADRPLEPRQTDLPGLLLSEPGVLICPALDLAVQRVGDCLHWSGREECARLFGQEPGA